MSRRFATITAIAVFVLVAPPPLLYACAAASCLAGLAALTGSRRG